MVCCWTWRWLVRQEWLAREFWGSSHLCLESTHLYGNPGFLWMLELRTGTSAASALPTEPSPEPAFLTPLILLLLPLFWDTVILHSPYREQGICCVDPTSLGLTEIYFLCIPGAGIKSKYCRALHVRPFFNSKFLHPWKSCLFARWCLLTVSMKQTLGNNSWLFLFGCFQLLLIWKYKCPLKVIKYKQSYLRLINNSFRGYKLLKVKYPMTQSPNLVNLSSLTGSRQFWFKHWLAIYFSILQYRFSHFEWEGNQDHLEIVLIYNL